MAVLWYLGIIYVAIGCWPAVVTWFAFPDMPMLPKVLGLLICIAVWPLTLCKREGAPLPPK